MLFLVLLIPMALLGAFLAWMSWRARHRRTALVIAGISLGCAGVAAVMVLAGFYFYGALPGAG